MPENTFGRHSDIELYQLRYQENVCVDAIQFGILKPAHQKTLIIFSHFSTAFVDILAAEQTPDNITWFQGTADAVRQCMHHFMNHEFDYALILSGDQLYQMDFNSMIKAHHDAGANISIATLPVTAKEHLNSES